MKNLYLSLDICFEWSYTSLLMSCFIACELLSWRVARKGAPKLMRIFLLYSIIQCLALLHPISPFPTNIPSTFWSLCAHTISCVHHFTTIHQRKIISTPGFLVCAHLTTCLHAHGLEGTLFLTLCYTASHPNLSCKPSSSILSAFSHISSITHLIVAILSTCSILQGI